MNIKPLRKKWKATMTDRQRFNNQMHYKPVDRCFNMEFGYWRENFQVWPMFKDNNIIDSVQANIALGFDRIEKVVGYAWMHPYFQEKIVEETETHKIIINRDGVLAEVAKDGKESIPHFIKPSITTPDEWKRLKAERFDRSHPDRKVDVDAIIKQHPPTRDYPVSVYCGSMIGKVRDILTFEGVAYATCDYPDMVEDMVETHCVLIEDFLDQVLGKVDFDFASGWEDICFKSGPIVSPDFFKSVVVPRYKRINKKLKDNGIDIWYTDCDGDVRPILPMLIESGINTMFPWEVNCAGHPAETLNQYGNELRIMGGFDKMILGQNPDAIKKYMESLVPLVERGGYIPFCDHLCPPNVKQDDYLYYLDLKEKLFGMPR